MARDVGNDFDGESISRAIGRGGPWKSGLFWALKWELAKRVQKSKVRKIRLRYIKM